MSYTLWYGLHSAASEEAETASLALRRLRELGEAGAKFIYATEPAAGNLDWDELAKLAAHEEENH